MRKSSIKRLTDALTPADMREICRSRNLLLDKGAKPDDAFIVAVEEIRQGYIEKTGLEKYLQEILGSYATHRGDCILVQRYSGQAERVVRNCTPLKVLSSVDAGELPFRIIFYPGNNGKKQVELAL